MNEIEESDASDLVSTIGALMALFEKIDLSPIQRIAEMFATTVPQIFKEIAEPLAQVAITFKYSDSLKKSGWLPHYTTPFDIVDKAENAATLRADIEAYYQNNWPTIRNTINSQVNGYNINEETKSSFAQILDAHESGLYALVPRAIFPEIEKAYRLETRTTALARINGQNDLHKVAGSLAGSEVLPGGLLSLDLFEKLTTHVYKHVNEDTYKSVEADPLPNRHATMHGYVVYKTCQSSLNAIFLADYIFQVLHAAKEVSKYTSESLGP